ncbi:MAG TPA: hypothetical protein VMK65_05280, partial [Longimicrobiales bacterium]|nr:hypothetical protein [Longimicrobiales bacterium]
MNPPIRRLRRFLSELRRRRVIRVLVGYVVAGWIIIQVAETTFPYLGLPPAAITLVIVLAIAGIPAAAILSWVFDITPSGIRETVPLPAKAPGPDLPSLGSGPVPEPSSAPAPAATVRLPVPPGPLIGRDAELAEAAGLLEQ